ncbi:hypothetical protein D3C84_983750 [compost metagenome]
MAFLGGAGDLAVKGFQLETDFLGLGFALDLLRRIRHRDGLALAGQRTQLFQTDLEGVVALVQLQQAFAQLQLQAGEQQLEGRGDHLARQGFR